MKHLLFALTFAPLCAAGNTEFDFLIGEHDVKLHAWTGTAWTPPRPVNAEWHGRKSLRDQVIQDEWFDPNPNQESRGINIRMYDEQTDLWKMMWISTTGKQVQELHARRIDGVLTMWQVHPERVGWKAEFEILNNCVWARSDFVQQDSEDWQPQFRLVATERDCIPIE